MPFMLNHILYNPRRCFQMKLQTNYVITNTKSLIDTGFSRCNKDCPIRQNKGFAMPVKYYFFYIKIFEEIILQGVFSEMHGHEANFFFFIVVNFCSKRISY